MKEKKEREGRGGWNKQKIIIIIIINNNHKKKMTAGKRLKWNALTLRELPSENADIFGLITEPGCPSRLYLTIRLHAFRLWGKTPNTHTRVSRNNKHQRTTLFDLVYAKAKRGETSKNKVDSEQSHQTLLSSFFAQSICLVLIYLSVCLSVYCICASTLITKKAKTSASWSKKNKQTKHSMNAII